MLLQRRPPKQKIKSRVSFTVWLVVGLGNPGSKYRMTRHNIGFMVIDSFVNSVGYPPEKKEHKAIGYHVKIDDEKVLLAKPQTFMNNSGEAVQALSHYYKIPTSQIIVIHDEVDLPFGHLKLQQKRGHGGNNGIRSIHNLLGTNDYLRIKVGVDRPPGKMDTAAHVLSNFSPEESQLLPDILSRSCDAFEKLIFEGYSRAATQFNGSILDIN